MKNIIVFIFTLLLTIPIFSLAQPVENNSNYWPTHRDDKAGFRISYPATWTVVQPKGANVRFSVNPADGPGNCNVVARQNSELAGKSQTQLNQEVESLPQDHASWAEYTGLPVSQVRLIESRISKIYDTPALVGTIEATLENLEGKYTRKQIVVLTFRPGFVWSLNCGASSFASNETNARFDVLKPSFNKILGSFVFSHEKP